MNKLMAIFICSMLSLATITPATGYAQSNGAHKTKHADGTVRMRDGKLVVVKNGTWAPLTADATMTDGTVVKTDGTVIKKDGTKSTLANGQSINPDGSLDKGRMQ
jgi:hypothetical protein